MRTASLFGLGFLLAGGLWWLGAAPARHPKISAPAITPTVATVNTSTRLVASVSITDPTSDISSVRLLRVSADGSTRVVAEMEDRDHGDRKDRGDEREGERKPEEKVFTARFTLNESTVGTLSFQVAVLFRGKDRVLSALQQFVVLAPHIFPVTLPPDPGDAGKSTLAGVDSDGDGIRDDVQRYIILGHPESEKTRAALTDSAKSLQAALLAAGSSSLSRTVSGMERRAAQCLLYIRPSDARKVLTGLEAMFLNTEQRFQTYNLYAHNLSGQVSTNPLPADRKTSCSFNVDSMEN